MSANREIDPRSFYVGLGCLGMTGVCTVAAVALSNEYLRGSIIKALAGVLPGQRPPIVQTATPTEINRIEAATAAITRTSNGTPLPPGTVLGEPTQTATRIIEATRGVVSYIQEILGLRTPVVRDSVWPGGIDRHTAFVKDEARIVVDIFNGSSNLVQTDWMRSKLTASRGFMIGVFQVPLGLTADGGNLTETSGGPSILDLIRTDLRRTSDTFFEAKTSQDGKVRIYEVFSPAAFSFNQIAVYDKYPGTAYVNNRGTLDNEKLYIMYIFGKNGKVINVLTFRGACGNIGQEEVPLPTPTRGATPTHQPTPTALRSTQTPPSGVTPTIPIETQTPRPSVTQAPAQPREPTRTPGGTGATPNVPTPDNTPAPVIKTTPIKPGFGSSPTPAFR